MKTLPCHLKIISLLFPAILSPVCPAETLRSLSTDRPDTTESTHTVDARHFQFEMEIAAWTRDGTYRDLSLGQVNFKIGLDDSTDFQVVTPFFTQIRKGDEGFGDLQIRLKRNLWGNDEGSTSMAVMPFVQLPTSSGNLGSDEVEGGVISLSHSTVRQIGPARSWASWIWKRMMTVIIISSGWYRRRQAMR
ncbi:MAG: transporter [Luteolibacter sp.]